MGGRMHYEVSIWRDEVQADLINAQDRLRFFPILRPQELIFSGIARFHYLTGNLHGRQTLKTTISRTQSKFRTAGAPSYIASFVANLPPGHPNKDANQLLDQHTNVPMLGYFLDRGSRELLRSRFLSDESTSKAFASLGLTKQPHMAFHRSLAFCPVCVIEDSEKYGIAHWHVEHQVPGTFICLSHEKPLAIGCDLCGLSIASNYIPELPPEACIRDGHALTFAAPPRDVLASELMVLAKAGFQLSCRPNGMPGGTWVQNIKALLLNKGYARLSVIDRRKVTDHLRSRFSEGLLRWIGFAVKAGRRG